VIFYVIKLLIIQYIRLITTYFTVEWCHIMY